MSVDFRISGTRLQTTVVALTARMPSDRRSSVVCTGPPGGRWAARAAGPGHLSVPARPSRPARVGSRARMPALRENGGPGHGATLSDVGREVPVPQALPAVTPADACGGPPGSVPLLDPRGSGACPSRASSGRARGPAARPSRGTRSTAVPTATSAVESVVPVPAPPATADRTGATGDEVFADPADTRWLWVRRARRDGPLARPPTGHPGPRRSPGRLLHRRLHRGRRLGKFFRRRSRVGDGVRRRARPGVGERRDAGRHAGAARARRGRRRARHERPGRRGIPCERRGDLGLARPRPARPVADRQGGRPTS